MLGIWGKLVDVSTGQCGDHNSLLGEMTGTLDVGIKRSHLMTVGESALIAHLSPIFCKYSSVFTRYSIRNGDKRLFTHHESLPMSDDEWFLNASGVRMAGTTETQRANATSEIWVRPGEGPQLSLPLPHLQTQVRGQHPSTETFPIRELRKAPCSAMHGPWLWSLRCPSLLSPT